MVESQEVIKGNYIIDMQGMGKKLIQFTPESLEHMIRTDLLSLYRDDISYFQVKAYEDPTQCQQRGELIHLTINIYFKCASCGPEHLRVITSYLNHTLIEEIN